MRELQVMFYLGHSEDIAWEMAFQMVLRSSSKEVRGEIRNEAFCVLGKTGGRDLQKVRYFQKIL